MTRAEQETLVRWDEAERVAHLYSTHAATMRRWTRCGYPVRVLGRSKDGQPRSWEAVVPMACVSFRRLAAVYRRTRTPTGMPVPGEKPSTNPGSEGDHQADWTQTPPGPDLGPGVAL
jgi:hypothetical protein